MEYNIIHIFIMKNVVLPDNFIGPQAQISMENLYWTDQAFNRVAQHPFVEAALYDIIVAIYYGIIDTLQGIENTAT
jgi:hypothetical protein